VTAFLFHITLILRTMYILFGCYLSVKFIYSYFRTIAH